MVIDTPLRKQETPYSCAIACLRMVLEHCGVQVDETALRNRCGTDRRGTRLGDLLRVAQECGLQTRSPASPTMESLAGLLEHNLAIAYVNLRPITGSLLNHAVIVESIAAETVDVIDLSSSRTCIPRDQFERAWRLCDNAVVILAP